MGLDSIELLMDIENYFKIQIPDIEAENIITVQNMVDKVAQHLTIKQTDSPLRENIFSIISSNLKSDQNNGIQLTDKISQYLHPGNKNQWNDLESATGLMLPRPDGFNTQSNKLSNKFKKLIAWTPAYNWQSISVGEFVDYVCACNYQELTDKNKVRSKYEILVAVMGITVEKIGVHYFEVSPEKSFTSDLGVD